MVFRLIGRARRRGPWERSPARCRDCLSGTVNQNTARTDRKGPAEVDDDARFIEAGR
jgi:hypothetical protein